MITKKAQIAVWALLFAAGLAGYQLVSLFPHSTRSAMGWVGPVSASASSYAALLAIRRFFRWLASGERPDCDSSPLNVDAAVGPARYAPLMVFALSVVGALLSI